MGQTGLKILCTFCALLASSGAQPTPGPSADAGSQIGAPAPGPTSSRVETRDLTLTPFSRVALCAPFTVLVEPSEGYQVTIDADDAVKQAITTLVDGNTLLLESNAFTTTNPIKVTVGLPATALSAITARGTFPAIVAPGFTAPQLTVNAQGTSGLNVLGISTGLLTIVNSGTGSPVVTGNITTAVMKNTGTGNLYVSGVNTSATLTTSGTGSEYVLATNANVQLTGTSSGLGHVIYNQGVCNIQGQSWVFGPSCQQQQFSMPDTSVSWSCGIQNTGRAACSGGSSSVSNTRNCPNSPVTWPTGSGQVSSFSVVDSKLGTALGLDTNSAPAAQAGAAVGVPSSPLAVNGLANGLNNTPGTQNGQGNGQGSVGAGNGNQNGNNNAGSLNGNGNGIGNTGNGNGVGNGNGNTNPQG